MRTRGILRNRVQCPRCENPVIEITPGGKLIRIEPEETTNGKCLMYVIHECPVTTPEARQTARVSGRNIL